MDELHFLAGLPRSGGTWLALILNQNPKFYAAKPLSLFSEILWRNYSLWDAQWFEGDLMNHEFQQLKIPYLQKLSTLFFKELTDSPVVIDNRREWYNIPNIEMYTEIFGKPPKIICPVRNVEEIAASYTKLYEQSGRHLDEDFLQGNLFEHPYDNLWATYFSKYRDCLLLVDYHNLVNVTDVVLDSIYDFIGEPRYQHNVDAIEGSDPFDGMDAAFNLKGLHKTNPGLTKSQTNAREILTKEQYLKFQDLSSWRNV